MLKYKDLMSASIEETQLIEFVPNISEGNNYEIIEAVVNSAKVAGARILDLFVGSSTNRSVITMVASPAVIEEAAFQVIRSAVELIDMRKHAGSHPCIGAADVCPFVPVHGATLEQCIALSKRVAERVALQLGVPVYLYAASASDERRRRLSFIRQGGFASLPMRKAADGLAPDYGSLTPPHPAGASIIGARHFLVAFNITLARNASVETAREIAARLRASGHRPPRPEVDRNLPFCEALGWYVPEYGCAQVSTNLYNFRVTSPLAALRACQEEAAALGTSVVGSELVGLVPLETMILMGRELGLEEDCDADRAIARVAAALGLDSHGRFEADRRILERVIADG